MKNLLNLQSAFQQCLANATTDLEDIVETDKVSAKVRLNIYVQAYFSRLIEALASHYPKTRQYLGVEVFTELGAVYVKQFPSTFRSIRWFGHQFVNFLRTQSLTLPVIELAQFEWTMTEVFDAADSALLTLEQIAATPPAEWPAMYFRFHPSLRRLNLRSNAVNIWQALTHAEGVPDPQQTETVAWILWRKNFMHQFCSLSADQAWALDMMMQGHCFADVCAGLCEWIAEERVAMHAASLLKGWVMEGLIVY